MVKLVVLLVWNGNHRKKSYLIFLLRAEALTVLYSARQIYWIYITLFPPEIRQARADDESAAFICNADHFIPKERQSSNNMEKRTETWNRTSETVSKHPISFFFFCKFDQSMSLFKLSPIKKVIKARERERDERIFRQVRISVWAFRFWLSFLFPYRAVVCSVQNEFLHKDVDVVYVFWQIEKNRGKEVKLSRLLET